MHRTLLDEQKQAYIDCLAYILNAEKAPTEARTNYLRDKMNDLCMDCSMIKKMRIKKAETIAKQLKAVGDIRIRRFILREMILLAISDHELSDKEIDEIYKIGTNAGIKEDKISDFFIWAAEGIEWDVRGKQLIEEDI